MLNRPLRMAITAGEPAGIGPDLCIMLAQHPRPSGQVIIADPVMLEQRAKLLGLPLHIQTFDPNLPMPLAQQEEPGSVTVLPISCNRDVHCGQPDPENASYVLDTLRYASQYCQEGIFDALVTAPVHKGVINDAGISFTGHTEYLQALNNQGSTNPVVMMLATPGLRVALVTTHLPLSQVPKAITPTAVEQVIRIVHGELRRSFAVDAPRLLVCGLNPHAGEGGHLGHEDESIIVPVLERLRREDLQLLGPLPADTLFIPKYLDAADAVVAMYHDQGLPVLKHMGFGRAVNITLGLTYIRTSVDHGTAIDLAGTGRAAPGSLMFAIETAATMITNQRRD